MIAILYTYTAIEKMHCYTYTYVYHKGVGDCLERSPSVSMVTSLQQQVDKQVNTRNIF